MTVSDIVALANAGFSKNDISVIMKNSQTQQAAQSATPTTVPTVTPPTAVQPTTQQSPADSLFNQLFGKLDSIQQSVINQNIATVNQPAAQTADDIVAEILNPPNMNITSNGGGNQ